MGVCESVLKLACLFLSWGVYLASLCVSQGCVCVYVSAFVPVCVWAGGVTLCVLCLHAPRNLPLSSSLSFPAALQGIDQEIQELKHLQSLTGTKGLSWDNRGHAPWRDKDGYSWS